MKRSENLIMEIKAVRRNKKAKLMENESGADDRSNRDNALSNTVLDGCCLEKRRGISEREEVSRFYYGSRKEAAANRRA